MQPGGSTSSLRVPGGLESNRTKHRPGFQRSFQIAGEGTEAECAPYIAHRNGELCIWCALMRVSQCSIAVQTDDEFALCASECGTGRVGNPSRITVEEQISEGRRPSHIPVLRLRWHGLLMGRSIRMSSSTNSQARDCNHHAKSHHEDERGVPLAIFQSLSAEQFTLNINPAMDWSHQSLGDFFAFELR